MVEKTIPHVGQVRYTNIEDGIFIEVWNDTLQQWRGAFQWDADLALNDADATVEHMYPAEDKDAIFVVVNTGDTYRLDIDTKTGSIKSWTKIPKPVPDDIIQIGGDAIYEISYSTVFVSNDTGATWTADTAGLGTMEPFAFDLDSSQNVYLATSTGLYYQKADSSVWRNIGSYAGAAVAVLVGPNNKIFASNYSTIVSSTDNGSTWNLDSAGMGIKGATKFWKDRRGNVYALASKQLYRSDGGTSAWVEIDQGINDQDYEGNPYVRVINDLAGDAILSAGTTLGSFSSTDFGATWTPTNESIPPEAIYGFVKAGGARILQTTDLGVYYKDPGGAWTKTFPVSACQGGLPLFQTNTNTVYTCAIKWNPSKYFSPSMPFVSTDSGATWQADTSGLPGIMSGVYFVDENGVQHLSTPSPPMPYVKSPGSSWQPDTLGFHPAPNNLILLFGSDNHGYLYVSFYDYTNGNGTLWKRPIGGGAWMPDSNGLKNNEIYAITGDRSGGALAGGLTGGVFRRTASTWSALPIPSTHGVSPSCSAFSVSVDSSGAIFSSFCDYNFYGTVWHGVFYTTDLGVTWTYVGLDSIGVRGLVSYGDTTYVYTYHRGVFKLTRNGVVSSAPARSAPASYLLEQNYPNPFNPSTKFDFRIAEVGLVSLKVFNVLGQEVATLVNGVKQPGNYTVTWNGSNASSGVYFYRLEASSAVNPSRSFVQVRKMMLVK